MNETGIGTFRLLLKPHEAAVALAISDRKLWTMTARGEVPCVRLGRAVRYRLDQLQQFLDGQGVGGR